MTREELATFDGRDGRRACVAINGTVYDFTDSELWQEGNHQELHRAGADLTAELMQAPHVRAVVERFAAIDTLSEPEPAASGGGKGVMIAAVVILAALLVIWLLAR
ncbi:MAG TPA: cytochrome b5 domain-containing protein [Desulfuromonadales bacterium]|nr:cytochrome b5 domain-containing protein [Desulfuromonadales bacterium]